MLKIILILVIAFVVGFLLFFPFWHVGGHYYRGLLLIYDIRPASGGGFLPRLPFERDISLIRWADPSSFEFVGGSYAKDRFSVYNSQYRLIDYDSESFHQVQAPITNEYWYLDKLNVRGPSLMKLKRVSGDREGNSFVTEKFDTESFQPLGNFIFKDKNGVYSYFRIAPFSEAVNNKEQEIFTIDLFRKHQELDVETFKIDFCNEGSCQASDKNGIYTLNRNDGASYLNITKTD